MARDSAQERRDNMNRGIPKEAGLDDGTRASLERSLEGGDGGIAVGSFRDLQVGLTDIPVAERPLNPNQDPDGVIDVNEHEAKQFAASDALASGAPADGDFDSMTVDELQDELRAQDKPVSGSKDELIARLKE